MRTFLKDYGIIAPNTFIAQRRVHNSLSVDVDENIVKLTISGRSSETTAYLTIRDVEKLRDALQAALAYARRAEQ